MHNLDHLTKTTNIKTQLDQIRASYPFHISQQIDETLRRTREAMEALRISGSFKQDMIFRNQDALSKSLCGHNFLSEALTGLSLRAMEQMNPIREVLQGDLLAANIQGIVDKHEELTHGRAIELAKIFVEHPLFDQNWVNSLQPFHLGILPTMPSQLFDFQNFTREIADRVIDAGRLFERLAPRTAKALKTLAANGWYYDNEIEFSELWIIEEAFEYGEVEEADRALTEFFESRLDCIEEELTAKFPDRAGCISAAFKAHRNGDYELSIPVLLAQTDGICYELTGHYFFTKRDGRPMIALYFREIRSGMFISALISPLAENFPITASKHERSEGFRHLNRHTIMHGENSGYGNRINSCKAVSLLNFVGYVLMELQADGSTL